MNNKSCVYEKYIGLIFYIYWLMNLKPKIIAHETGVSSKITYVLEVTN